MEIEMARLDHFGLVAGVFDQLGISEVIDNRLPKSRHHKLSHSQVLKAMVLNGLGFVGQRLYLFPSFFENLPVDKLLGKGVAASDLNGGFRITDELQSLKTNLSIFSILTM